MPQAEIGMQVMVDLAGFNHGGVSIGEGGSAAGTITAVAATGITVKLNATFAGIDIVTVDPARVTAIGA